MKNLARILAEDVLTFAYCDSDEIDEDFAVKQLERISYQLKNSAPNEIEIFKLAVVELGKEAAKQGKKEESKQYQSMIAHLGLD